MTKRTAATSTWGNPDEAARARSLNEKRQQKEESRPSYQKKQRKRDAWLMAGEMRKLKRRQRRGANEGA